MRAAIAAALIAAALVLFPAPIVGTTLRLSLDTPVVLTGVRWTGFGDWTADSVSIGESDRPRAVFGSARVDGLFLFLTGGRLRVRFEKLEAAGESFGRSTAWIKRRSGGVLIFTDLRSSAGHARGGVFWRAGKPEKISGRVTLSPEGMKRIPRALAKRLSATSGGPAFTAAYAADRIVLRGRGVPILEAAWQLAG